MSVGEHSGERIACALMAQIREQYPDAEFFGVGGELMQEHGFELHYDLSRRSIMWFWDAVMLIPHFVATLLRIGRLLSRERPDAVVAIDSPAFNMYMMKAAWKRGIPAVYYVAPQAWAYNPARTVKLGKWVDRLLVVLPFEVEFFRNRGVAATYVGHPLFEDLTRRALDDAPSFAGEGPILGVLPGSRATEVERSLPVMLRAATRVAEGVPGLEVVVSVAKPALRERVQRIAEESGLSPHIVDGSTPEIIAAAKLCLVTSGTATLETSFYETPAIVLYRTSALNLFLARPWMLGEHIALPNLVAGERILDEFLTPGEPVDEIAQRATDVLTDEALHGKLTAAQKRVRERMLKEPRASQRAAREICALIRGNGAAS